MDERAVRAPRKGTDRSTCRAAAALLLLLLLLRLLLLLLPAGVPWSGALVIVVPHG
jgi:hypothetical protein